MTRFAKRSGEVEGGVDFPGENPLFWFSVHESPFKLLFSDYVKGFVPHLNRRLQIGKRPSVICLPLASGHLQPGRLYHTPPRTISRTTRPESSRKRTKILATLHRAPARCNVPLYLHFQREY